MYPCYLSVGPLLSLLYELQKSSSATTQGCKCVLTVALAVTHREVNNLSKTIP